LKIKYSAIHHIPGIFLDKKYEIVVSDARRMWKFEADEDIGEEDREWQHVGTYC